MDDSKPHVNVTLWHHAFYQLLIDRGPPSSEIQFEVNLSLFPSRVDLLLLRRTGQPSQDDEARVLRGLWPLLSERALVDFKSPGRAFRSGELLRLLRYGLEYHEIKVGELASREALTLVLIVPRSNKALRDELTLLDCTLTSVSAGYARLHGKLLYTTYIVFLEDVAEAEHDDYLRLFTHKQAIRERSTAHWLQQWLIGKATIMQDAENLEGYDEMVDKLLALIPTEKRLESIPLEKRMASIPLEKRVEGASADELFESLSDEQRQALVTLVVSKLQH